MKIWVWFIILISSQIMAQEVRSIEDSVYVSDQVAMISDLKLDSKNPMKASIYSAVLPGLGQAYNEKYWKVPIVWGLIGTGIGVTVYYNNRYHHYRDAFIAEYNGLPNEYTEIFGENTLERLGIIQDDMRRNRDYAIAVTVLAYALNVLDATVDAHLYDIRKDKDLSVDPTAVRNPVTGQSALGLSIKFNLE